MQVSIPTIRIKILCEYYSEIRMHTIDVALSTDLSDRITSSEFKSMSYKFKSAICELKSTGYEVKSTSQELKSTSSSIIKSMKIQVNNLKIFSLPKILSLKSFGNSRGHSSVQFLVIIPCFNFPLFHGYRFSNNLSRN